MGFPMSKCDWCKKLKPLVNGWQMVCDAFPESIPMEVMDEDINLYCRDKIRFEPKPGIPDHFFKVFGSFEPEWQKELWETLETMKNPDNAIKMSAYMKNKFTFLGIPKPDLKSTAIPFIKMENKKNIDWEFVFRCWKLPFREAQYVGLMYLEKYKSKLEDEDIEHFEKLITDKSWWDTVDMLSPLAGIVFSKYPLIAGKMLEWSISNNMWIRRASILAQLKQKEKTDIGMLETILLNNLGTKEFFINKAIGWSLREYSKTNKDWVREFINKHKDKMSGLSIREGSKYL